MSELISQSDCPSRMEICLVEKIFPIASVKLDGAWEALQQRETFVDSQIPPYKVEFDAPQQTGPFSVGELNIHHGPLLSVHGRIGDISSNYRDLEYFYGSYVLSFRWIRPVRLQFFKEENGIRMRLKAYVAPWMRPFWLIGNSFFWSFFGLNFIL